MNTVGSIVKNRDVFTVQRGQSVLDAVKFMVEKGVGALAVLNEDRLVGIFSERDLMKRVVAKGLDPRTVKVEQVMTSNLVTAHPNVWQKCNRTASAISSSPPATGLLASSLCAI
jgi:CBS domain-containing protein